MKTGRSKVSEKGWVVIPKPIRDAMGLAPGDEVGFFFWPSLAEVQGRITVFKVSSDFRGDRGAFKHLRGKKPITRELVEERRAEVEQEEREARVWRRKRRTSA